MFLTVLTKIWDNDHVEKYRDTAGKNRMQCLWCNNMFSNWYAIRMTWYLLRIKGNGLVVCNNLILPDCLAPLRTGRGQKGGQRS